MNPNRPLLLSIVQYQEATTAGSMSIFDVIRSAQRFGVAGVELRREAWPNYRQELAAARELAQELGLRLTYATFSTVFSADGSGQAMLRHDIETAAALGSPLLRVLQGPAPVADDDPGWDAAGGVIGYASSLGVTVALENYGRTPGGTLAEVQRMLALIPGLMANIDPGNYFNHREDIPAAIRAVGSRAVYAHLKDQTGVAGEQPTYLGGGIMDLPPILAALDALPQTIPFAFEFAGGGDPDGRIRSSLAYLGRN